MSHFHGFSGRLGSTAARVLLVGDGAEVEAARGVLTEAGYQTRHARDGGAAISALEEAAYELVVISTRLLDDDGVELCRSIRAEPRRRDLYVIVLISTAGPTLVRLLSAGADDFVTIPFDEVQLLVRARAGVRNAQLHSSETRLRTLIANVPGAIYRCANDENWTMELISDEISRISGYPPTDFIDNAVRSFASIIHPDDLDEVARLVAEATRQGKLFRLEYRIIRADGGVGTVLERGQEVADNIGRTWLDGVIFDVTDWRRAENELHRSQRRLAIVEDRERIARELHDGVIQVLFGLGLQLQAANDIADLPDAVRACLSASVDCLDTVVEDIRNYVFALRPVLLVDRELADALRQLVKDFQDSSQVVTVIDIDPAIAARLTPRSADILQFTREALSNVQRHARATTCRITLKPTAEGALLKIDDDGCGFAPTATAKNGQGLRNLAERSRRLGGGLEISSSTTGTTLTVRLPPDSGWPLTTVYRA